MNTIYVFQCTVSSKTFLMFIVVFEKSFFLVQVLKKINENNYLVSLITGAEFDDEDDINQYIEKFVKHKDFKLLEQVPFRKKKSTIVLLKSSKYILSKKITISSSSKLPVGFLVFSCRLSVTVQPTEDLNKKAEVQNRKSIFSKIKSLIK